MMKIVLCFSLFIISLAAPDALEFLVLGDWGKGGNGGNILNTLSSDQFSLDQIYPKVTYERADSLDTNKEGGGKGGGGQNRKQYTYQAAVARAMSTWANHSAVTPSFVVAVGDNFYDDGVQSSTASSWNTLWKYVYLSNYSNLRIPWYPVLGNHGIYGDDNIVVLMVICADYGYGLSGAQAQVDRFKSQTSDLDNDDISTRLWQLRGFNYSEMFSFPCGHNRANTSDGAKQGGTWGNENGKVAIVFIDTTTLAPSENKCCNENG